VEYDNEKGNYYNFSIDAFGWYNVDQLLTTRDDLINTSLTAQIIKPGAAKVETYLIIPSIKLFVQGGHIKGEPTYGFDAADGTIPLPLNTEAFIFSVGEMDNQPVFGITRFFTKEQQNISVEVKTISKEKLLAEFSSMNFQDLKMQVDEVENQKQLKDLREKQQLLENSLMLHCDCDDKADTIRPRQPKPPIFLGLP
jgi:hypothetical protein